MRVGIGEEEVGRERSLEAASGFSRSHSAGWSLKISKIYPFAGMLTVLSGDQAPVPSDDPSGPSSPTSSNGTNTRSPPAATSPTTPPAAITTTASSRWPWPTLSDTSSSGAAPSVWSPPRRGRRGCGRGGGCWRGEGLDFNRLPGLVPNERGCVAERSSSGCRHAWAVVLARSCVLMK